MIDAFVLQNMSHDGKRFGFVRFSYLGMLNQQLFVFMMVFNYLATLSKSIWHDLIVEASFGKRSSMGEEKR